VERDEVDRQPRQLGGSWQQKFRRRFYDISPFSRPANAGIDCSTAFRNFLGYA